MSDAKGTTKWNRKLATSAAILLVVVSVMAWLRLHVFREQFVTLSYAVPLLICLWHQDKRLLWCMAGSFLVMTSYKTFDVLVRLTPGPPDLLGQWLMQVANITVSAVVIHLVITLNRKLEERNALLQQANDELAAREEEISRQNEELQSQSEELRQQNEELQSQSEESTRQNEELQEQAETLDRQTHELQTLAEAQQHVNHELDQREAMLNTILSSFGPEQDEKKVLRGICEALTNLINPPCGAAAVVEQVGQELVILAKSDHAYFALERWPAAQTFAGIVMAQGRTAFVDDLAARPDLRAPQREVGSFRSILACPLRIRQQVIGTLEAFSEAPAQWTSHHFRIIEWAAAQCSRVLETMRYQAELQAAQVELAKANQGLEEAVRERTARLQETVGDLEHFSYTITHDMRAPLRAMQGFSEILRDQIGDTLSPEHRDFLGRIISSAARMDRLITDALSYSKVARHEFKLGPVDPNLLLKGMIDSYPSFQQPQAVIDIEGQLPVVVGSEAGLTQCFSNLLGNAVKFVPSGQVPHVRIRPEQTDGRVRIWVEDDGIGIAPEAHKSLFTMFQRATQDYEGTGVGLALVKKVAERMGGSVGLESAPGKGSRFWLELKLADHIKQA